MAAGATRLTTVILRHPEYVLQAVAAITVSSGKDNQTIATVSTHFRGEMVTKNIELKKNERGFNLVVPTRDYLKNLETVSAATPAAVVELIRERHFPGLIPCEVDGVVIPPGLKYVNPFDHK